ncbi:unnamed protein product [Acanthoscelides obtectus]|uniref:DUF4485 domain-containing protein n=1 Tax=Acanthoscelides obtectus TaxID=200917 RepID=A0A9P0PR73_ACAOB|nr:unnamed protein product [Acanthoscelides obtectus]CAK1671046.1 hypothetical protein AOBTE_LOCUS28014 [Acanthoscelides obtectus]
MGTKDITEFRNALKDIANHSHSLESPFDRVRCVEWCRMLSGLSDDDLESCKRKNEYIQLMRIQVRNQFLHGPFVNPPPDSGKLVNLAECLGNLMANQIPYLPRMGPISPILQHKSPDGRAYISAKQIPGAGVFCYMAVSPDGLKCQGMKKGG